MIDSVDGPQMSKKEIFVDLTVESTQITLKVDTGAKLNIIAKDTYEHIRQDSNIHTAINQDKAVTLQVYGGLHRCSDAELQASDKNGDSGIPGCG